MAAKKSGPKTTPKRAVKNAPTQVAPTMVAKPKVRARAEKESAPSALTAEAFLARLEENASEAERMKYVRFFPLASRREGDVFLGVRMGTVFELAKAFVAMEPSEIERLMESDVHEARAGVMSVMAKQYAAKNTTAERRQVLFDLYLRRHDRIDDWDLVDLAAHQVIGAHLVDGDRAVLRKLARSKQPFERRTAIVATFAFVRRGQLEDTFALAELLVNDPHELVQKAVGWALRATGGPRLTTFLDAHASYMPRPMLRAAIEKLSPSVRASYLARR